MLVVGCYEDDVVVMVFGCVDDVYVGYGKVVYVGVVVDVGVVGGIFNVFEYYVCLCFDVFFECLGCFYDNFGEWCVWVFFKVGVGC